MRWSRTARRCEAAGVTAQTPAPPGGRIENGLFVDNAKELINKAVPAPTPAELDEAFAKAQDILLGFGVTGVGSMSTALGDWEAMKRAGDAGRLNVRFMVYADELNLLKEVPKPTRMALRRPAADGRASNSTPTARSARAARGSSSPMPTCRTAAGCSSIRTPSCARSYDTAASHGFQIATHAIGDAANAQVISGYEWLNTKYGTNRRWRIEHAQIVDCADLPRIGRRAHDRFDAADAPDQRPADGREKARSGAAQMRLCVAVDAADGREAGVRHRLSGGIAQSLSRASPRQSSREDINGQPPGGWYPNERLTLAQALHAYTRGAAYAGFAEDRIGGLDPGKWADFVIVDRDPTQINAQELARTQVLETWIGGKKVWERAPSASPTERGR